MYFNKKFHNIKVNLNIIFVSNGSGQLKLLLEPLKYTYIHKYAPHLSSNMESFGEKVEKWMELKKWVGVNKGEGQNWIQHILSGKNGEYLTTILWHEKDEKILANFFECWTHCPVKVPPDKKQKLSECLMIFNCDRHMSHFSLDYRDGELICKSIIYSEDELTFNNEIFESVVNVSFGGMDMTYPLFTKLIYSDTTIEKGIDEWSASIQK
jgi:hypothetical protein